MKFNLLKKTIPKDNIQEVIELESWTVTWKVKSGWSNDSKKYSKVLIKESDAKEYKKQLEECAEFIGAWISTEMIKN